MRQTFAFLTIFLFLGITGCKSVADIPPEFPTPPPPPPATPAPKINLKADPELEKLIAEAAIPAKGKVGAMAVLIETGDCARLNADGKYPMQSVYKLPISMAILEQVNQDKLAIDEKIGVTKDDMVRQGQRSPLRDTNPNGGEFTIEELIRLAMVESDGTASDVLMRVAGGAGEADSYVKQLGIQGINVANSEKEIGRDWETQYRNWATPSSAAELLCALHLGAGLDKASQDLLLKFMTESTPGAKRIKGLLPPNTPVAHKTGTGGTQNGITGATNDIGIITLPNGKHAAVAVFVSDSPADEKTREAVIARIAKAVWDKWSK